MSDTLKDLQLCDSCEAQVEHLFEDQPYGLDALREEADRCKLAAVKASGHAVEAIVACNLPLAEQHFCRASRLLLMAMSTVKAIRLLDGSEGG